MNDAGSRRIVEALRTGVPTHDAVVALGAGQPHLEAQMSMLLSRVRSGAAEIPCGFVFNGSFGSGKSHLLEAFAAMAVEDNFAVSRAVISKNLPLHSTLPVLVELVGSLRSRVHGDDALLAMFNDAFDRGAEFAELQRWSNEETRHGRLAPLFPGLLSVLRRVPVGSAPYHTIIEYLSGAAVPQGEINTLFRAHASHIRDHTAPKAAQRAAQTVRFLSRLFLELGHAGWIVLFDELELIRLLGPVARGKGYAEITKWMGLEPEHRVEALGVVGTVTSDFVLSCIIDGHRDLDNVPVRLRASPSNYDNASLAVEGMRFLMEQQVNECSAPDARRLEEIQESIRAHYAMAFDCSPSRIRIPRSDAEGVSIRAFIRRWITLWDLERQGRKDALDDYVVAEILDTDVSTDDDRG